MLFTCRAKLVKNKKTKEESLGYVLGRIFWLFKVSLSLIFWVDRHYDEIKIMVVTGLRSSLLDLGWRTRFSKLKGWIFWVAWSASFLDQREMIFVIVMVVGSVEDDWWWGVGSRGKMDCGLCYYG